MKPLIYYIEKSKFKIISIIGMEKNAGKTVTLNTIIKEAHKKDMKMAVLSYGRDGETVDAITRQQKPRIYIPPGTLFVTTDRVYNSQDINASVFYNTNINTLLGNVNIYKNESRGGFCELTGVNTVKQVNMIKKVIPEDIDLILIDGALDRRSSAMPDGGYILATGAVAGDTEQEVIDNTADEIEKLSYKQITDERLKEYVQKTYKTNSDAVVDNNNILKKFSSDLSFNSITKIKESGKEGEIKFIILNGALVDSFVERLSPFSNLRGSKIIVKDGCKIFLKRHSLNILKKYNIEIRVANSLKLIALTVNPLSPTGSKLDSAAIIAGLSKIIKDVPVFNLMEEKYKKLSLTEGVED